MSSYSVYIHIPFCAHRCDFCNFTTVTGLDYLAQEYTEVLCQEIAERLQHCSHPPEIASIYFGGGTPGLIDPDLLCRMLAVLRKHCNISDSAEVTLETTPTTVTLDKSRSWLRSGINRISIGVESLCDDELAAIGRDQTGRQSLEGIECARQAGFSNINADLLYGLPGQTLNSWTKTLRETISLGLPHLSAYGLQLGANARLTARHPADSPAYPDEATAVELYEYLVSCCQSAELAQYEVSNFARAGFESKHNLSYWTNDDYFAFGAGAHRYINGVRSSNWRSLKRYMRDYLGAETSEVIDEATRVKEAIFLGLRLRRGINLALFARQYGINLTEKFSEQIKRLVASGHLALKDNWLTLTQHGVLVSNLVLAEFM